MPRQIIDLTHSQNVSLQSIGVDEVTLEDSFWEPRREINRISTIPSQIKQCEDTHRVDNLRRVLGNGEVKFEGIYFNDSDVYKVMEAISWSLATHPDAELDSKMDELIEVVASAQQPDGYLNSYFMFEREKERFTNLKDMHELYCAGHLIQAAVAHHRATGKSTFLEVAKRLSDCLYVNFGPDGRPGACGHPEAEMALVELARETGDERYLVLAKCMIDARGMNPPILGGAEYHQDHQHISRRDTITGHAVRDLYLMCGGTDVVLENGDENYLTGLNAIWDNFTSRRIYVNGGAGARHEGEAFGVDYELPNSRAYNETCAAIASVMWQYRMLHLTGEAKYASLMEHTLYNAVLPGLSLNGMEYFYENPLEDNGTHRRQAWFGCACCPPNVARLMAQLPGYFASTNGNSIYLHLYAASEMKLKLDIGVITLKLRTEYPFNGSVQIDVEGADAPFDLYLRVPHWVKEGKAAHNGNVLACIPDEYVAISAVQSGDKITLEFPFQVELLASHSRVVSNRNQVAIQYGPLIYCIEQADLEGGDIRDVVLNSDTDFKLKAQSSLPGNIPILEGMALICTPSPESSLYHSIVQKESLSVITKMITAVPYYVWANREPGPMRVWIPME